MSTNNAGMDGYGNTEVPDTRRKPNAETYHLGHNEVMQVAIALQFALDNNIQDYNELANEDTLASFQHIFGTPGNVSITKDIQEL